MSKPVNAYTKEGVFVQQQKQQDGVIMKENV